MEVLEDIQWKFGEHIKLRGFDDQYIDRLEEKEILQTGIEMGLSFEQAYQQLKQISNHLEYILESELILKIEELITKFLARHKSVNQKQFNDIAIFIHKMTKEKFSYIQCQKMVKEVMIEKNWQPQEALFDGKWFEKV